MTQISIIVRYHTQLHMCKQCVSYSLILLYFQHVSSLVTHHHVDWQGGANPGLCDEGPATNRLSHDTEKFIVTQLVNKFAAFIKIKSSMLF
jgi:hypothetical protein